ncbi:hypothetical protein RintRC_0651 [Richelia intracellularis]|nr:hypothetical protein RintRC_0651 [Richelia intracellularis]
MALALDNQDIPYNYVQKSVIFIRKLDALTLGFHPVFHMTAP